MARLSAAAKRAKGVKQEAGPPHPVGSAVQPCCGVFPPGSVVTRAWLELTSFGWRWTYNLRAPDGQLLRRVWQEDVVTPGQECEWQEGVDAPGGQERDGSMIRVSVSRGQVVEGVRYVKVAFPDGGEGLLQEEAWNAPDPGARSAPGAGELTPGRAMLLGRLAYLVCGTAGEDAARFFFQLAAKGFPACAMSVEQKVEDMLDRCRNPRS